MIRGKYLRERKAIRFKRRVKLLICMLIVTLLYKIIFSSYSLYESEANSVFQADVAFFVLDNTNINKTITLEDLTPGTETSCSFSIANFITEESTNEETNETETEEKVSETDIEYTLTIRTTTNLPLVYSLYLNDNPVENSSAQSVITDAEIVTDSNSTFFNKLIETKREFTHDIKKTDIYILYIEFPTSSSSGEDYTKYTYQNIIETIEISVDAKQVID